MRRYGEIAEWLTGRPEAAPEDGVRVIEELVATLQIPKLALFGINAGRVSEIVAQAQQASSMKANPVVLTPVELTGALTAALA